MSLAAAGILQAAGLLSAHPFRLQGAAGNAAIFAALAFAASAVALHEATRPGRSWPGYLAVLNLAFVILSGTRMAILATFLFAVIYGLASRELRRWLRARPVAVAIAASILAGILLWYLPILEYRMLSGGSLRWSERDVLWPFYFREFLISPLFGRGFGTGFVATSAPPHNEYLHLLVIGGGVGFALCMTGIVLWLRQLLSAVATADRAFLIAAIPAVARLLADRQSPDLLDRARALRLRRPAAARPRRAGSGRCPDARQCNDGTAPEGRVNRLRIGPACLARAVALPKSRHQREWDQAPLAERA